MSITCTQESSASFMPYRIGTELKLHGCLELCPFLFLHHVIYLHVKENVVFQVSVIQMEGTTILYQKQIPGQVYSGIMSLQFVNHGQNGSENSILLVGMEDSSVLALEEDSGHALSANPVKTKKTCKALLMHILGMP